MANCVAAVQLVAMSLMANSFPAHSHGHRVANFTKRILVTDYRDDRSRRFLVLLWRRQRSL
jgi:hypothetical protein